MSRNYIEFISAYCDRWCERCAFTQRCSAYAIHIAIEMCEGDAAAAMELAVGRAASPNPRATPPRVLDDIPDEPMSAPEIAAYERERDARDARIDESPLTTQATVITTLTHAWLEQHRDAIAAGDDDKLREAVDVIGWDQYLIGAKLHRALNGRDEADHGESWPHDHPIQNDWNGSAKVALISIERSRAAWRTIADVTDDVEAARLAEELAQLQRLVDEAFPDARKFVRPGFDDEGKRKRKWFR